MSSRSKKTSDSGRAAKKAAVLETPKKSGKAWVIGLIAAGLVAGAAVGLVYNRPSDAPSADIVAAAAPSGNRIAYPAALFADGRARHYTFADGNIEIRYFVVKSRDGVIRAAFDACDVCWPENKGYEQAGDVMVCRNCGREFSTDRINEVQGGCNPAPLRRSMEGQNVVLNIPDIRSGRGYFDFSKRDAS